MDVMWVILQIIFEILEGKNICKTIKYKSINGTFCAVHGAERLAGEA
jgi:hypothetical protein